MPPCKTGGHDPARYKLQLYAECWTKLRMWELEEWDRWGQEFASSVGSAWWQQFASAGAGAGAVLG